MFNFIFLGNKMWIESLGLRNFDKDIISSKTAWLFDDHLDVAFNMLYEHVAFFNIVDIKYMLQGRSQ